MPSNESQKPSKTRGYDRNGNLSRVVQILMYVIGLGLFLLLISSLGCAAKPRVVEKPILVPGPPQYRPVPIPPEWFDPCLVTLYPYGGTNEELARTNHSNTSCVVLLNTRLQFIKQYIDEVNRGVRLEKEE